MNGGGAERVISNLSMSLEEKYNIFVITMEAQTDNDYPSGGTFISLYDGKNRNFIQKQLYCRNKLKSLIREYNPKVVISFLLNACLCSMLCPTRAKRVLSVRNYIKLQLSGKKLLFWEMIFKTLLKKADVTVSVSECMNRALMKDYGFKKEKLQVIYNPYYKDKILKDAAEDIEDELRHIFEKRVLINVGSFGGQKGQNHLIRATSEVIKSGNDINLVFVGGKEGDKGVEVCKNLAKQLNISDNVFFFGHRKNPYKYVKKSKLFVFPSLYEGFPNALAEAMVCGIPVISADCKTGPREILAPDTDCEFITKDIEYAKYGVLIPVDYNRSCDAETPISNEEKLLQNAIEKLLRDSDMYSDYCIKSSKRSDDFSIEEITKRWIELIEKI